MRRRRPPFALVLSALVAAAALAIVLTGQKSGSGPPGRPPTVGIGPGSACVTTAARASSIDRSGIVVVATVEQPVSVTEQASGPNGTATVTRSEVVSARIKADQPVEITETAGARGRACARGSSTAAARSTALREAYARALKAAHSLAASRGMAALNRLVHRQYPAVAAEAKREAGARAHQLALAAEAALAAQAQTQARRRAGG